MVIRRMVMVMVKEIKYRALRESYLRAARLVVTDENESELDMHANDR